jgi:hypothetical protein
MNQPASMEEVGPDRIEQALRWTGERAAPDTAASRTDRLDAECSRLVEELAGARQEADRQAREYQDRIAALLTRIDEREYELWERDSKIASLTLAYDGLRERLDGVAAPGGGVAVGAIDTHRRSADVVESLKARLEERGRALTVAREELAALHRERAKLVDALAERGQQVAQLLAQLTRAEVGRGFGMDFRSGLRRLFQRDPAVATGDNGATDGGSVTSEEPTIVLEKSAGSSSGEAASSTGRERVGQPVAAPAPGEPGRQVAGAPTPRAAAVRLRRYLLPLKSDLDPVFELAGARSYVGRGIEADVCISHPTISRLHGVFYCIGGATMVEDARSTNGVFVNRQRVQQSVLKDGDVVAFGNVEFHFRVAIPEPEPRR